MKKLIGDIRNEVVSSQAILSLMKRGRYTEVQAIIEISKKLLKMVQILLEAEKRIEQS